MPHKYNADRRHRIPRARYKVTNWRDYEAGLRQRGSLTIWFSEEAVAAWRAAPRTTPGGQARYSDLAIETSLILRTVFHQPLRQTEGLVGSLLELMGLDLPVPDHSTLSRRSRTLAVAPQAASGPVHLLVDSTGVKLSGPGEWLVEKHGTQRRRAWRKLHLCCRCEDRHDRRLDPDQQGGRRCRRTRPLARPGRRAARRRHCRRRLRPGSGLRCCGRALCGGRGCRAAALDGRAQSPRPKPTRPSATAISRPLPSRAGWAGSEPPATMRGPGRRLLHHNASQASSME